MHIIRVCTRVQLQTMCLHNMQTSTQVLQDAPRKPPSTQQTGSDALRVCTTRHLPPPCALLVMQRALLLRPLCFLLQPRVCPVNSCSSTQSLLVKLSPGSRPHSPSWMMSRCTPSAADSTKFHRMNALAHPATFQRKRHVQYCICGPQKKYTSPARCSIVQAQHVTHASTRCEEVRHVATTRCRVDLVLVRLQQAAASPDGLYLVLLRVTKQCTAV
jgi:hypothetical protein